MQITSGKIEGAKKVILYGPEGIGKSTFASQFPNPLFIDTEGSTKDMDVRRLPTPGSWTMLMQEVDHVRQNPHLCATLVIDTADWAEKLCIDHVCAANKWQSIETPGYGKGIVMAGEEFGRLLNLLDRLIDQGVNVLLTAHATMRKFEQPDEMGAYDRWELKLSKRAAPMVKEWGDMVLFANYKTFVVKDSNNKGKAQGGQRVMYTSHHPAWDAKNRAGFPEELPLHFAHIASYIPGRDAGPYAYADSPEGTSEDKPDPVQVIKDILTKPHPPRAEANDRNTPAIADMPLMQTAKQASDEPPPKAVGMVREEGIPDALWQLMQKDGVSPELVRLSVFKRGGYYTADTPFVNYDPNFIKGVLIGAWDQVRDYAKSIEGELPF